MNIFYLNKDPVEAARAHLDKHVVKMILEYAQLLSTAHRIIDGKEIIEQKYVNGSLPARYRKKRVWRLEDERDSLLYSATHVNHPSAVWARASSCNYEWLYRLFCATCDEYTHRYGKIHVTDTKLRDVLKHHPKHIGKSVYGWLGPTPAMPDECKVANDALASYKRYYIDKKADMAKWTNREPPDWFIEGLKEKDAYLQFSVQELRSQFRRDPKNGSKGHSSKQRVSIV